MTNNSQSAYAEENNRKGKLFRESVKQINEYFNNFKDAGCITASSFNGVGDFVIQGRIVENIDVILNASNNIDFSDMFFSELSTILFFNNYKDAYFPHAQTYTRAKENVIGLYFSKDGGYMPFNVRYSHSYPLQREYAHIFIELEQVRLEKLGKTLFSSKDVCLGKLFNFEMAQKNLQKAIDSFEHFYNNVEVLTF